MSSSGNGIPAGTQTITGLAYHSVPGFRPLELDLYLPERQTKRTLVLYVHGGGWRLGTRRTASPPFMARHPNLFHALCQAGFSIASIDYRLSGEAVFPAQLNDVRSAVTWAGAASAAHGVDCERLILWGDSAGAQLAALAAFQADPGTVAGLVAWYPISDLPAIQADADAIGGEPHDDDTARETGLLGGRIREHLSLAANASPTLAVRPGVPPTFVAHGTTDLVSPYRQGVRLVDAVLAAGGQANLHTVDNTGHMWSGANSEQLDDLWKATTRFLDELNAG